MEGYSKVRIAYGIKGVVKEDSKEGKKWLEEQRSSYMGHQRKVWARVATKNGSRDRHKT